MLGSKSKEKSQWLSVCTHDIFKRGMRLGERQKGSGK